MKILFISQWFKRILSSPQIIKFNQRHPELVAFLARRFSASFYLGLYLTIGLIISAIFGSIFGDIMEDILTGSPLVQVDQWVMGRVLYFRSPLATSIMEAVTNLGGIKFITFCSLAIILYLLLKKNFYKVTGFASAIIGESFLNFILKALIQRPRPISDTALIPASGWSFPSGHAMSSVVFYGMIVYMLIKTLESWRLKSLIIGLAVFIVVIIGFSRIYLQVHYLSDVVAGFTCGLFWLSMCITALEIYTLKRKAGLVQNQSIPV